MDREDTTAKRERRKNTWRSEHRARAHDSAHADPNLAEQTEIPEELQRVSRAAALVVADDPSLLRLIEDLRASGRFAYDSEFIGELTYFPKLCLIQVASESQVALIDPLADIDLRPFWELLADAQVEKIVHAGEQDLEPVNRHMGKLAANVVDTQIAAAFIGLPYPLKLSKLVWETTKVKLGKGLTFSHWDQRPLSTIQLRYAADDVRYLPAMWAELERRLKASGHLAWAKEESESLCQTSVYQFDPQTNYSRIRGATGLPPRNLAVLRELTILRDDAARKLDVPPRTFLRDEVLLELARNPVRAVDKLARVRGLPRPVEHDYGALIIERTAHAMALPVAALPPSLKAPDPSPPEKFRSDALFAAGQSLCAGMGMDPALVASRAEFDYLYQYLTGSRREPTPLLLQGWRKQAVGDPLTALLSGTATLSLSWEENSLRARRESAGD